MFLHTCTGNRRPQVCDLTRDALQINVMYLSFRSGKHTELVLTYYVI